jgi:orotate phosphoribosyltransferase-like protein
MMLNRTEKEQRVTELYHQGKTIREIAQEVHMSFGDIGFIIKKVTGLDDDNKPKQQDKIPVTTLSKDSQAFALLSYRYVFGAANLLYKKISITDLS